MTMVGYSVIMFLVPGKCLSATYSDSLEGEDSTE